MPRLFPPALLACIAEGRTPLPHELACVTEKVYREAFRSGDCKGAATVARFALSGADGFP